MPPPTAHPKTRETDIFKLNGSDICELISQRYERGVTVITSNLPFDEWTETFGSARLAASTWAARIRASPASACGIGQRSGCRTALPSFRHRRQGEAASRSPTAASPNLAAGVGKLDAERCRTRTPAEANNVGQRRLVCIGIEAEAALTDAAHRFDRSLLDDDNSGAR